MEYPYLQLDNIKPTPNEKIREVNAHNCKQIVFDASKPRLRYFGDTMLSLSWVIQYATVTKDPLIIEIKQGSITHQHIVKTHGDTCSENIITWKGLGLPMDICNNHPTHINFSKNVCQVSIKVVDLEADRKFVLSNGCRYYLGKEHWTVQHGNSFYTNDSDICRVKYDNLFETCVTDYVYFVIDKEFLLKLKEAKVPPLTWLTQERVAVHTKDVNNFDAWYREKFPDIPHKPWIPVVSRGEIINSRTDMHSMLKQKLDIFLDQIVKQQNSESRKGHLRGQGSTKVKVLQKPYEK